MSKRGHDKTLTSGAIVVVVCVTLATVIANAVIWDCFNTNKVCSTFERTQQ